MHALLQSAMPATGAGNDFQKDEQFRKLNAQKDIVEVTVVRGGSNKLIPNTEVVVGDVLVLTTGDKVTAGTPAPPWLCLQCMRALCCHKQLLQHAQQLVLLQSGIMPCIAALC